MPSSLNKRTRQLTGAQIHGTVQKYDAVKGTWSVLQSNAQSLDGIQETVSEGHPWKGKYSGDVGGPFSTRRQSADLLGGIVHIDGSTGIFKYDGHATTPYPMDKNGRPVFPAGSINPKGDINSKGATAISLCSPTNSVANAATFLGELYKDRLPSIPGARLWEHRTKALLGVADEFLNTTFGWLPLVADVTNFGNAVRHARTVMDQYKRDEGKLVRRSFSFPTETSYSSEIFKVGARALKGGSTFFDHPSLNSESLGTVVADTVTQRKTWFKGAFTYHIPSDNDYFDGLMSAGSEADKLFGTSLTPEVLWELTPWSWAVDWFSNAQQVINNLQNMEIYGLVIAYGYMMDENITTTTYRMTDNSGLKGVSAGSCTNIALQTRTKHRVRANPFGFGVEMSKLSATQNAILAALGISRAL